MVPDVQVISSLQLQPSPIGIGPSEHLDFLNPFIVCLNASKGRFYLTTWLKKNRALKKDTLGEGSS